MHDTGTVEQNVDAAQLLREFCHRIGRCHVQQLRFDAIRANDLLERPGIDVGCEHPCTLARERNGRRPADAGASGCHQGRFSR